MLQHYKRNVQAMISNYNFIIKHIFPYIKPKSHFKQLFVIPLLPLSSISKNFHYWYHVFCSKSWRFHL